MDEVIKQMLADEQCGTGRNYLRAKQSFSKFLKGKNITFHALNERCLQEYEIWLRKRNVSRNTISFYMRILRAVYNKAVQRQLVRQTVPFAMVYTGVDKTVKRAIDLDVIIRLKELDLSCSKLLSFSRDLFLFSFYMRGMAFIDMAFLKKNDIRSGILYYTRQKTGITLSIRLEPCMWEIIRRYASRTSKTEYLLPILSSSDPRKSFCQYQNGLNYYNRRLKTLSDMLNIDDSLSSYVSRHSWATAARNKNVPLAVISAGMGHNSETTTQIYLASINSAVVDDANFQIISSLKRNK
jgi:integrase